MSFDAAFGRLRFDSGAIVSDREIQAADPADRKKVHYLPFATLLPTF